MSVLIKNILNSSYSVEMRNLIAIKRNSSIGFEVLCLEHHLCSRQTEDNVTHSESFQMKLGMLIYDTGERQNLCKLPMLEMRPF